MHPLNEKCIYTQRPARNLPIQDELPLKMLVQSEMVGAIIGKSGGTIKQITQLTRAKIDVHREESSDRNEKVISISGPIKNCSDACFKIVDIIQNEALQLAANNKQCDGSHEHTNTSATFDTKSSPDAGDEMQLKILAPNNLIGRLIGKGGSSIKKIMEQTSTKINISTKGPATIKNEHTITITGSLESIRNAESIISTKLRAAYSNDLATTLQSIGTQPYLLNNNIARNPYVANAYANPVMPPLMGAPPHPHPHPHPAAPLSSDNHVSRSMSSHTGSSPLYQHPTAHGYLTMYPNFGPAHPSSLFGFNSLVNGQEYEKETIDIFIPNSMVGAIIGVSGSTIKEMINYSGATIKIAPVTSNSHAPNESNIDADSNNTNSTPSNHPNSDNRTEASGETSSKHGVKAESQSRHHYSKDPEIIRRVTIVGYPESQYMAQYLIYRKVSIELGRSDTSLMVEIRIPSQFVGRIIGKGGASIKKMQKQTHTTIRLPEDQSNNSEQSSETTVLITGEFQGSQLAQRQLRCLIKGSNGPSSAQRIKSHPAQEANAFKTPVHTNTADDTSQNEGGVATSKHDTTDNKANVCAREDNNASGDNVPQTELPLNDNSRVNSQTTTSTTYRENQVNEDESRLASNNNNLEGNLNHNKDGQMEVKMREHSFEDNRNVCLNGTNELVANSQTESV